MYIPKQVQEVAWNRVGDQVVVLGLHLDDRSFHELNSTASAIWSLIDGVKTENEIAQEVAREFEVEFDQALADTRFFLQTLFDKKLISYST